MSKNIKSTERFFRVAIGLMLVFFGVVNSGYLAIFVAAIGLFIFYTGVSGHCSVHHALGINKKFERENFFLSEIPNQSSEPVLVFNTNGALLFKNEASKKLLSSIGSMGDIVKNGSFNSEPLEYEEDERIYLFHIKKDEKNALYYFFGADVTEIELGKERLEKEIITDTLTGCKNIYKLREDLKNPENSNNALMVIDINNFAEINSFAGSIEADKYLVKFSKRLTEYFSKQVIKSEIYRLSGDIFVVSAECDMTEENGIKVKFESVGNELIEYFSKTEINIKEIDMPVNVTLGFSCSFDAENVEDILRNSQTALMEAKRRGVSLLMYDDVKMVEKEYEENIYWSKKLKSIFHGNTDSSIEPFFQPIYNLKTEKIEKFEALARIIDNGDVIPPYKFINIAKKTNMATKITHEMIKKSFDAFKENDFEISLNITADDLKERKLAVKLNELTGAYGIANERVVLEVLEDEEFYEYTDSLCELKKFGYKIAIDDFGTGYSNFSKLQQIRADYIKIDGSLIKNIDKNSADEAILKTIIEYSKIINTKTIAEFVHSKEVFDKVREIGVDYVQGYYIAEPSRNIDVEF